MKPIQVSEIKQGAVILVKTFASENVYVAMSDAEMEDGAPVVKFKDVQTDEIKDFVAVEDPACEQEIFLVIHERDEILNYY